MSAMEAERIYSGANSAIWHSHHEASCLSLSTTREEDYVATLIRVGTPLLAERWAEVLAPHGVSIRVSGVFCHGRPQVRFDHPGAPVELADLLIVHRHMSKSKRSFCRALLIQAKMSDDGTHVLAPTDAQLHLFTTWPDFVFVDRSMDPAVRKLKETGKGSRYALVRKTNDYPEYISWPDQSPWAEAKPAVLLEGKKSFAKTLGDMLLGLDGRPTALVKPANDWSRLIAELLETTGAKTFRRANIRLDPKPRLTDTEFPGELTLFVTHSQSFTPAPGNLMSLLGVNLPPMPQNSLGGGGSVIRDVTPEESNLPGGISTLAIETQSLD